MRLTGAAHGGQPLTTHPARRNAPPGEQDGRYIGRFSTAGARPLLSKEALYLRLMRHFDRMADDLGGRLMSLNSLYFTHHARTGLYTALGSETAQGLPNAQLFYAFLRE